MFINPKIAIEKGWIKGNIEDKHIQPNAIDFTIDKLFTIDDMPFVISEQGKNMRGGSELSPNERWEDRDYWILEERRSYDAMSNFYVELPEGIAALLIVRSTFNRNGLFVTSGGTRVGQIIFVESENALMYAGGYNHAQGTHAEGKQ
jgi:deoxycytidine triphosphate deaminase